MSDGAQEPWRSLSARVDGLLIPVAFGLVCVLVGAQLITSIPVIRRYVDAVSGRFVSASTSHLPASIASETAQVQLFLSPGEPRPDVTVFVNQKPVGTFTQTSMTLVVHDGDSISVESGNPGLVTIQVNYNNPNLLTPSMGQLLDVDTPNQMTGDIVVRFLA